jgi:preprotein translocase subunit SecY
MALEFMDTVSKFIPSIQGPKASLSLREKMKWTAIILGVFFLLYGTYVVGVNQQAVTSSIYQLISIISAARIGSVITVGISPIVLSSILLQLFSGSGIFKIDMQNPVEKARFQSLQKLLAIVLAFVESIIYVLTGFVPISSPAYFLPVVVQLAIGAIMILYLDEMMSKWGVTSGINLFIAAGVSYAIVAGIATVILPQAAAAIGAGGAGALSNAVLAFGPLFFSALIFVVSLFAYQMKVELPLSFNQLRGIGGRLPIPFLYVSVLPVVLTSSLEAAMIVWLRFISNVGGSLAGLAKFIALYQPVNGVQQLNGGLVYLISPQFPSPYAIGGYGPYFSYLASHVTQLYLPWGGAVGVPEWVHIVVYTVAFIALCVVFGKFWVEMTGQSPREMAEQLEEMGWQIPGFRRDPRVVENMLNKYIPTITVLGSMFVGLLAAVATLTGSLGSGMGILLTVGIIFMLYQQLEQEGLSQTYPLLGGVTQK